MYQVIFKPFFDYLISFVLILILLPVIIIIWLLVLVTLGSPALFNQLRPGKNEKVFNLYKFRTMTNTLDIKGEFLPDSERITKFGIFLRKTSLDELPQLFNVLKGDISLVGPRPLLVEYLSMYSEDQRKRHKVKPGITGWAQVNGRNAITWDEKFKLDIYYIENISFFFDMKILFKTIVKVLTGSGIYAPDGFTMDKFTGNSRL